MASCDIIVIDCSKSADVKRLKHYRELEKRQHDKFTRYLTLDKYGCRNKHYTYYIAVKPASLNDEEQLCGVAQTSYGKHYLEVNYLTSRAATDSGYKGVGTKILNAIINHNKDDPRLFGVLLISATEATGFYLKYGFKHFNDEGSYMFYPFKAYTEFVYHSDKMRKEHLNLAIEMSDINTVQTLLDKGIVVLNSSMVQFNRESELGNKLIYISPFLVEHFYKYLDIDEYDFYKYYIEGNDIYMAIAFLKQNKDYVHIIPNNESIINLTTRIHNGRTVERFIQVLYDSRFRFDESLLHHLIYHKNPSLEAIKLVIKSGVKLNLDDLEDLGDESDRAVRRGEVMKEAYNLLSA